jgi:hypothetical protein
MPLDKLLDNAKANIKAYGTYFREKKKQAKLKRQVKDVQALHRAARGQQPRNRSAQLRVDRAAGRLGVNPGIQYSNPKVR